MIYFCARVEFDRHVYVCEIFVTFFFVRGILLSLFFYAFYPARGRLDSGIWWIWGEGESYIRGGYVIGSGFRADDVFNRIGTV